MNQPRIVLPDFPQTRILQIGDRIRVQLPDEGQICICRLTHSKPNPDDPKQLVHTLTVEEIESVD